MLGNVTLEVGERDDARVLYEESLASRGTVLSLGIRSTPLGTSRFSTKNRTAHVSSWNGASLSPRRTAMSRQRRTRSAYSSSRRSVRQPRGSAGAPATERRSRDSARRQAGHRDTLSPWRCGCAGGRGEPREAARVLGAADQLLDEIGASSRGQLAELIERRMLAAIGLELDEVNRGRGAQRWPIDDSERGARPGARVHRAALGPPREGGSFEGQDTPRGTRSTIRA